MGTIGTRQLRINGGPAIKIVGAPAVRERDLLEGIQQPSVELRVVAPTVEFRQAYPLALAEYQGQLATLDSLAFRVGSFSEGETFIEITLIDEQEAQA